MKRNLSGFIRHDGRVDFEDNDKTYTIMSVIPVVDIERHIQNVQRRLRELGLFYSGDEGTSCFADTIIYRIFEEEFGNKLLEKKRDL